MPYIPAGRRTLVEPEPCFWPSTPGELNFAITMLLRGYLSRQGMGYSTINDALGALEGAKLEFYRRVAASYEDQKIIENGDVY